jgi:hypothetical protein
MLDKSSIGRISISFIKLILFFRKIRLLHAQQLRISAMRQYQLHMGYQTLHCKPPV